MKKRTMVIDGTFMLKRLLREYTFMENPESDRIGLLTDLSNHMACEIERVIDFVDNIVMCRDSRSWRKDVKILHKIQIDREGAIEPTIIDGDAYKANRIASEDRNWTLIYDTFNEFCECLNTNFNVPYIAIDGAEGDDAIWAVCEYLRNNKKMSCVYCTDSDLNQLVTPSNIILRRVKSKNAPEGEVIVNSKYWDMYNNNTSNADPLAVFSTDVTKFIIDSHIFKNKSLGHGIFINYPYYNVLKSMVMGSPKDNVPEIFSWSAKSTRRHITEKHINAALELSNISQHAEISAKHLYDELFLRTLISNLIIVTKQNILLDHIDYLYSVLINNRKLNYLSKNEIPIDIQTCIFDAISNQSNKVANISQLKNSQNITESLKITGNKIYQNLGI